MVSILQELFTESKYKYVILSNRWTLFHILEEEEQQEEEQEEQEQEEQEEQ